jgi:hypothetical protein
MYCRFSFPVPVLKKKQGIVFNQSNGFTQTLEIL